MKKVSFLSHSACLYALFFLGNAVISAPFGGADEYSFIYLASAVVIALLCGLALCPVANLLFENGNKLCKGISSVGFLFVALYALVCLTDTFKDFGLFVSREILPDLPDFLVFFCFAAVAAYFFTRRQENVLKYFLLSFAFCLALFAFFFLASLSDFDWRNIFVFKLPSAENLSGGVMSYLLNPVLPTLLLPIYDGFVFKKTRPKAVAFGIILGGICLSFAVLSSLLLFGPPLAGKLEFPYSAAVSTVNIGRLFTRLDGFSYFIYFSSAMAKITVCGFVIKSSLKQINQNLTNKK